MDTAALRFDPIVCVSGMESFEDTLGRGRGTILVATHANAGLARLILRPLHDQRVPDHFSCRHVRIFAPAESSARWSTPVRPHHNEAWKWTQNGSLWVADQLIRLARRCDASIVFCAARLESHGVAVALQRPAATSNEDAIIRDFVSFIEAHIAETVNGQPRSVLKPATHHAA